MRPSNEPLFWSLFSAGGMLSALVVPALVLVTGLLLPAGAVDFDRIRDVLTNPLARLVLFGICALTFAHAAHRLRHTLVDLGMKPMAMQVAVVCYAVGALLTLWAAVVAFG
jgi:fumarate reductase subunit D